ncbi:hypothetical protein BCR36DRAFT_338682 [Piromyces finnis]|uniref:DH domain-containing protein n=1 Tax=Piromyces finnis TaxID=1754191 RepID=A0A1Y1UUU9_9FUNG|nr:hypothetical protein BCR36DRAFT_338682 [Piromyces finnis]|eukprot:ORX41783.1 hypothetical protein BCR36DRAFT_338682 [Piromyces finnis]
MSLKSEISDLSSTNSVLNIAKAEIMNTSIILNPEPIEYCLTKFNFEASKNDELSFKANQYIRLTKKVDGGWWEGKLDERIGWFPSDFVTTEIEPQKQQELAKNDKVLSTEEMSVLKYKNIVFNRSQLKLSDLDDGGIEISESEFVRNEITKDLIHSEEAFIEDIKVFTNQFIKPMENETWISYADRNDMFGRFPWLSNLHICLTSELKSALNQPEEKNLGNCFSCVIQNFEIVYSDYFSSFPRAIYVASQYNSNNKMTTFLVNAGCQSLPPILHILSFLHKPIQRIAKYSPILSELLHFTKPEDPGFNELVDMVTKFKQLETYLKTLKNNAEKQERLKNLYNSIEDWVGPGIENYGELLLESKVHLLDPTSSSTTPKSHFIYLLEKLFVVLKPISKADNTKYNLVVSVPVWKGTLNIINDINDLNTFQVIFLPSEQSNKLKSLVITVAKPEIKKQWVDTVKRQLEKNVRLTLPSLPKEIQDDLSSNDTNQSKKKWKKLVPKFARTKGKNETTLPPYTSSNLLLKTSEGGTLISSELSNLEHKIITEEKRKQGKLLKIKYEEEETLDSPAINDYSSGVTSQSFGTIMYDNLDPLSHDIINRDSTSSTDTCSSASSKMTTICTKYNAVERNAYSFDNTSSYSEGTAFTNVNTSFNQIGNHFQMTRMTNENVLEAKGNDEFDRMMRGSSVGGEEEEEKAEDEFDRMMRGSSVGGEEEEEEEKAEDEFDRMMRGSSVGGEEEEEKAEDEFDRMMRGSSVGGEEEEEKEKAEDEFDRMMRESYAENRKEKAENELDKSRSESRVEGQEEENANDKFDGMMGEKSIEEKVDNTVDRRMSEGLVEEIAEVEFNGRMSDHPSAEKKEDKNEQVNTTCNNPDSAMDEPFESSQLKRIHLDETMAPFSMEPSDTVNNPTIIDDVKEKSHIEQNKINRNTFAAEPVTIPSNEVNPMPMESTTNPIPDTLTEYMMTPPMPMEESSSLGKEVFTTHLPLFKKGIFEPIKEMKKSFDTTSILHHKKSTTTWFSEDSKSETEELKRSVNTKESLLYQSSKEDIHKDNGVNILLELEELEKRNKHKKNEFSEISSTTSLKSVQMISKFSPLMQSHDDVHHSFSKSELPQYPEHQDSMGKGDEVLSESFGHQDSNLYSMYKNKNIVKEDLSTLLTSNESSMPPLVETSVRNKNISGQREDLLNHCTETNEPEVGLATSKEKEENIVKDPQANEVVQEEEEEKKDAIINKIIEAKIAQEIKEKCGDISNKDLTIKIRINEEDTSKDINIEIKINRNTEDKIPAVTIETEKDDDHQEESQLKVITAASAVSETEPVESTAEPVLPSESTQNVIIEQEEKKEKEQLNSSGVEEGALVEASVAVREGNSAKDMATQTIENPTVHDGISDPIVNNQPLNTMEMYKSSIQKKRSAIITTTESSNDSASPTFLHNLISSPSTVATEATDVTLSMIGNEEDKMHKQSCSMDSYESKATLNGFNLSHGNLGEVDTSVEGCRSESECQEDQHFSAVKDRKKLKSPPLPSTDSPVIPSITTFKEEKDHIVEYGLLEKQFKSFLSRHHLQVEELKDNNRYSDSFVRYQNVDFKKESEVFSTVDVAATETTEQHGEQETEMELTSSQDHELFTESSLSVTTTTTTPIEETIPLLLTKRLPSTLNHPLRHFPSNLRYHSDSYTVTNTTPVNLKTSPSNDDLL